MPHETPNPHDAEEQLRPYLGELHEAREKKLYAQTSYTSMEAGREEYVALDRALGKALQLLGVRM